MKVTYWKAPCLNDSDVYSIRATTRKECKAIAERENAEHAESGFMDSAYGKPEKIVIEYSNAFDLISMLRNEDAANY